MTAPLVVMPSRAAPPAPPAAALHFSTHRSTTGDPAFLSGNGQIMAMFIGKTMKLWMEWGILYKSVLFGVSFKKGCQFAFLQVIVRFQGEEILLGNNNTTASMVHLGCKGWFCSLGSRAACSRMSVVWGKPLQQHALS